MYVGMCVSSWDTSLCCVCVCMCMYIHCGVHMCVYVYKRHVCVYLGHRPVVCMCVPRCV